LPNWVKEQDTSLKKSTYCGGDVVPPTIMNSESPK
jgi:hypothetical protein